MSGSSSTNVTPAAAALQLPRQFEPSPSTPTPLPLSLSLGPDPDPITQCDQSIQQVTNDIKRIEAQIASDPANQQVTSWNNSLEYLRKDRMCLQEQKLIYLQQQQQAKIPGPGNKKSPASTIIRLNDLTMSELEMFAKKYIQIEFPGGSAFTIKPSNPTPPTSKSPSKLNTPTNKRSRAQSGERSPIPSSASSPIPNMMDDGPMAIDEDDALTSDALTSSNLHITGDKALRDYIRLSMNNTTKVIHFYFEVVTDQKEVSKWEWKDLKTMYGLSRDLALHRKSQPFIIQPLPTTDPLLQSIVKHTTQALLAENLVLPPLDTSNEAVASEYVSEIMTAICLYFHKEKFQKSPQQQLVGDLGRGPVDFLLQAGDFSVCVTEVKRFEGSLEQGCAQNIAQLNAVISENKSLKKRKYAAFDEQYYSIGVVSNGQLWYVIKCKDKPLVNGIKSDAIQITKLISLPLDSQCAPPECISSPPLNPDSSVAASASASSSSADVITRIALESTLTRLLSYLIPPIRDCWEYHNTTKHEDPKPEPKKPRSHLPTEAKGEMAMISSE